MQDETPTTEIVPPDSRSRTAAGRAKERASKALPQVRRWMAWTALATILFVVYVTLIGALAHTEAQRRLRSQFRTLVASGRADRPTWKPTPGVPIAIVSIPEISVDEVIVQDTTTELLKGGPGHLLTSPLPGYPGNSIILARRITHGAPFRSLQNLEPGDVITIVTPQGAFAYAVTDSREVLPGSPDVFAQSTDARLTLVTSNSPLYPSGRFAVSAVLLGNPLPPVEVPVVILQQDQLGLGGDTGAIVLVIPWALAFVASLFLARGIRRRISSTRIVYALASPIVLLVLWMLFRAADRLLPGTL